MAINKNEKKKIKLDAKKIGRILSFAILTIALLIGIIFSSVKVNMNLSYGPEYNGAYQASVQVVEPDGKHYSMDTLAGSLSDKLAPFSDKSITVTKNGKSHLNVVVGKNDYQNNETYLRNQIQSNGGLFMLTQDATTGKYSDFYLTAKDATSGQKRLSSTDFFTDDVSTQTLSDNTAGRQPFVHIGLKMSSDNKTSQLAKVLEDQLKSDKSNGGTNAVQPQQAFSLADQGNTPKYNNLTFVTNLEQMIDTLRFFYVVNDSPKAVDVYYNDIIKPMQDIIASSDKNISQTEKEVLRNLFGGTVKQQYVGGGVVNYCKISLLDKDIRSDDPNALSGGLTINDDESVMGINSEDDLKKVIPLFTPNTADMPTSKFIYSPDAKKSDMDQKFIDWFTVDPNRIDPKDASLDKVFGYTVNNFMTNKVLFAKGQVGGNKGKSGDATSTTPGINPDFISLAPQLDDNILYTGNVSPSTTSDNISGSISSEVSSNMSFIVDNASDLNDSRGIKDGFYLRTRNLTSATKAVSSIKQNAMGVTYLVESITNVNPYITHVLYITSVVFLSIIALLLAIYILFVYRLLGLFTIIIAACSVAITLLAATGFGIAMGPQVICALFLIIALIMDSSFIIFDGWKRNFYEEKHGIISSFKIGNRATLAMAVDAVLVAFIPNVVLFWVASGPLKTFGTLAIIGTALAVVCGIIIGRFIYWLILKAKFVQKTDWLLPIDTRYSSLETLRDEFAINKYTSYLENHEGKTNYTTKELAKISEAKQKLEVAQKSYTKHQAINNVKVTARDEKTVGWINRSTKFLNKLRAFFIKIFRYKHPETHGLIRLIDGRIDDNKAVLDIDKETDENISNKDSKLKDKGKIVRADRMASRGMTFLMIGLLVIGVIAAIVGGVLGVTWANGVGYGQQFVVYGDQLTNIQANLTDGSFKIDNQKINGKWQDIQNEYQAKESQYKNDSLMYAYELRDFFEYLNNENDLQTIGHTSTTKNIKLGNAKFDVVYDYRHVGTDGKALFPDGTVALRINSNSTNKASRSALKRLLVAMATGEWPDSDTDKGTYDTNTGGIEAYDVSPYTVSEQIRNVGIAFGIALAVLVAYIFIRFKWTYYVALALGLGLVIGTVVALITIFRVPMSTEMLCGMVFVITFALTSMILVLGKGKSKLNLSSKENIKKNFSGVIKLSADMRAKKAETKAIYVPMRKKLHHEWWEIFKLKLDSFFHKGSFDKFEELHDLTVEAGQLRNDYKAARKEQVGIYKDFKDKTKAKQSDLQRKNWYFKSLFSSLIKYSAWRIATLGVFYLLVGIILAATLPSIFGMGLTIIFGLIAGFSIALFFTVPVWVYFEKRRIRYVYGRKQYIESLKVSHEEEIIKGIND